MRLLFIRHGDPDYANDSLTERGKKEAELLSEYLESVPIDHIFFSPYGRAHKTAEYTLRKKGMEGVCLDWLREFDSVIDLNAHPELKEAYAQSELYLDENGQYMARIPWDMLPGYLKDHEELLDTDRWQNSDILSKSSLLDVYNNKASNMDALLEQYGYQRNGAVYDVTASSHLTLAFFTHYGTTCALLSHLLHIPLYSLWAYACSAPSSITEVVTEERETGTAVFRMLKFGAVPHLEISHMEPSFAARFAECYEDKERH